MWAPDVDGSFMHGVCDICIACVCMCVSVCVRVCLSLHASVNVCLCPSVCEGGYLVSPLPFVCV